MSVPACTGALMLELLFGGCEYMCLHNYGVDVL